MGRFASMARAGLGTAASMVTGSGDGLGKAVDRLADLRGLGTKVGQMAGLLEANLPDEIREQVGPALAKLRAQAVRSPYPAVAALIEEELGGPPHEVFATFEQEPFASASLGQVHEATSHAAERLAVKVQHPGIGEAFAQDLANVSGLGRMATALMMPSDASKELIMKLKEGFLAELDYVQEAANLEAFAELLESDEVLELPEVVHELSTERVLSTTFLEGVAVEEARGLDEPIRRQQAAAIRRLLLSALTDHGLLYADAHAGNFLFRADGSVGVLDFGSVFRFDEPERQAFAAMRDAAADNDREAFGHAVEHALQVGNEIVAEAIADVQWVAIGGLVRGEAIAPGRIREITSAAAEMKRKILAKRFRLPYFMPFLMRTMLAANALLSSLDAPASGPLQTIGSITPAS